MLFNKDIRHICALCENSVPLDGETVLCRKKGPVSAEHTCRSFKYDPLKRVPPKPAAIKAFSEKDFEL